MKTVAINQSNYIPWKGYFDLIHDVDVFLFLDDVQYTSTDWRNRNLIKTHQGLSWLSIPVGTRSSRLIRDVEIRSSHWQTKHWRSIEHNYHRSEHFKRYREFFEWLYLENRWRSLSELNQFLVRTISKEWLGITTEFLSSEDYPSDDRRQERVFHLVRAVGGTVYISGTAAKAYIDPRLFEKEGIDVRWKDYHGYPEYVQLHDPFVHTVSVIDLLFNTGPEAPYFIWDWRDTSDRA